MSRASGAAFWFKAKASRPGSPFRRSRSRRVSSWSRRGRFDFRSWGSIAGAKPTHTRWPTTSRTGRSTSSTRAWTFRVGSPVSRVWSRRCSRTSPASPCECSATRRPSDDSWSGSWGSSGSERSSRSCAGFVAQASWSGSCLRFRSHRPRSSSCARSSRMVRRACSRPSRPSSFIGFRARRSDATTSSVSVSMPWPFS